MAVGHPAAGVTGFHRPDRNRELGRVDRHPEPTGLVMAPAGGSTGRCDRGVSAHGVVDRFDTLSGVVAAERCPSAHVWGMAGSGGRPVRAPPGPIMMTQ